MRGSILLACAFGLFVSPFAHAQSQPPPGNPGGWGEFEPYHLMAWVDPVGGVDGPNEAARKEQLNDPDAAFKTLQAAIDTVMLGMLDSNPTGSSSLEGTVYALPGVYGPATATTPNASGDVLPIVMRDRVHVQGFGNRRCILRGDGSEGPQFIYWPDGTYWNYIMAEVLLDLSRASHAAPPPAAVSNVPPPWYDPDAPESETVEVFDGFTFQGGDIQVIMRAGLNTNGTGNPWVNRAVVSNCVFDMRDGWSVSSPSGSMTIPGPTFGVMLLNNFTVCASGSGYLDTQLLVANNTFVMAQWSHTAGWIHSKNNAVGIINVNDPGCHAATNFSDCDILIRGMARPGLINNVFRTKPGSNQMAMLGIDLTDTRVLDSGGSPVQTNAFAPARVGSASPFSGGFVSVPVNAGVVVPYSPSGCPSTNGSVKGELLNCGGTSTSWTSGGGPACTLPPGSCPTSACTSAAPPTPQVSIYDGTTGQGADPAFVGEYLAQVHSTVFAHDYADWRILPGASNEPHPFQDRGFVPAEDTIAMANGTTFPLPTHPKAPKPFKWDGEYYGNPRVVDGSPDLGHDEIHLVIMAGSYSPNSTSHNAPGFLAPDLPTGLTNRYVLVRRYTPSVTLATGNEIKIHGTRESPNDPQTGWVQPPGTLVPPTIKEALPVDYQKKWIRFAGAGLASLPWTHQVVSPSFQSHDPLGTASLIQDHAFVLFVVNDNEGSDQDYFNTQGVIFDHLGEDLLRSNLQTEYR